MALQDNGLFGPMGSCGNHRVDAAAGGIRLIRVAFENSGDRLYDYAVPGDITRTILPGMRVKASFGRGNRAKIGFCVATPESSDISQVKMIDEVVDDQPLFNEQLMELGRWISNYYCCPLAAVLSAMAPSAVRQQAGVRTKTYLRLTNQAIEQSEQALKIRGVKGRAVLAYLIEQKKGQDEVVSMDAMGGQIDCSRAILARLARDGWIELVHRRELGGPSVPSVIEAAVTAFGLNPHQQQAFDTAASLIDRGEFCAMLLYGVTGSGKTEVYMRCIEHIIQAGRQALVLVPEIAMTPQIVGRFLSRFGRAAVLHSGLSRIERHRQWRSIAEGGVDIVVGARSAIFAPLDRLGLIVVDEEHEPSYKQEQTPRYHGRDVAIKRAQLGQIPIILGSATPSLETWNNCTTKSHYHLLKLPERVMNLPMPQVRIVDMVAEQMHRKGTSLFSGLLEQRLRECLDRKRQAILLLNRRGHSHFIYCPSCKYTLTCPNCDVALTYHRPKNTFDQADRRWVMCHYCLYRGEAARTCPVCKKSMILIGPGTQRAEVELEKRFPNARIRRVDSDSVKPVEFGELLSAFGDGQIDILLGTQMVGKGLDFPNVDLVGVLTADTSLSVPDFRSSERTFQLIAQVAGRCGRAGATGEVIVQTYQPTEPSIRLACRHNYDEFSKAELELRRRCEMPPFARLARIILRDPNLGNLEHAGEALRFRLESDPAVRDKTVRIHGPMPAGIARLENYHRWQVLIRAMHAGPINELLGRLRSVIFSQLAVQAVVDMDPMNLL